MNKYCYHIIRAQVGGLVRSGVGHGAGMGIVWDTGSLKGVVGQIWLEDILQSCLVFHTGSISFVYWLVNELSLLSIMYELLCITNGLPA